MHSLASLSHCLAAASVLFAWELVSGYPFSYLDTSVGATGNIRVVENTSGSTITIPVQQYTYTANDRPLNITGSSNTEPAWTTKFTPLTTGWLHFSLNTGGEQLANNKYRAWKILFDEETGKETWLESGSNPPNTVSRNRSWTYFKELVSWEADLTGEGDPEGPGT